MRRWTEISLPTLESSFLSCNPGRQASRLSRVPSTEINRAGEACPGPGRGVAGKADAPVRQSKTRRKGK